MPDNREVEDLLERWDDLRQQGREVTAEELCQDRPDLVTDLKRRIHAIKAMNWLFESDSSAGAVAKEEASPAPRPVPTVLGRYRLNRLIGSGGFGQVWEGFDPELQRVVAIKIPNAGRIASADEADKFLEEARKVAQLKHPGIVPVHDVGRDGDYCFIVSDFVDGGNLAARIGQGKLKWQEAARLVAEIARILHFAHEQGFIHRDVKPANILMDSKGTPFLADFGIAVREAELQLPDTSPGGTLAYMSPEQARGALSQTDSRTDIFSLGVVLYRMLTGQLPFQGRDAAEMRQAILSNEPKPPRALDAEIPGRLERICLKALAKKPEQRYSTAKDFAIDLQAIVDAHQHRWFRRAVVAVAVVLIIGFGVWHPWSNDRQHGEQSTDETVASLKTWVKSHAQPPLEHDRTGEKFFAEAVSKVEQITSPQIDAPNAKPSDASGHSEHEKPQSEMPTPAKRRPVGLPMFNTTLDLTGKTLTESDYQNIGRQLMLRRLILANTPTADAHLPHLTRTPALEYLDLGGTQVTDAGLKTIGNLPMLSHLSLARTGITGLKGLSRLRLSTLDLSDTKITDAGLESLGEAGEQLRELDLSKTAVGDDSLPFLKRLRQLETLRVGGTKISERGIGELRTAIPDGKVVQ